MSGRQPARNGLGGAAHPSPPPPRQQCSIKTLTLDGSLFDAPATGRPVGGSPKRPAVQAGPLTGGGSKPRAKPRLPPAGAVLLDNGEAESAFIDTLRSHYTRNGTAESFAPKFAKTPEKTYSRSGRAGAAGSGAAPGGLAHQERALWEEREEELVDAQERRFAQLEDALAARESKREAYLVHRLEATAAKKIEEHRRTQEAAARARQLAVQRVQQLPSLQKAHAAAQPASPTTAALQKLARSPFSAASPGLAAVQQAVAGVSSLSALSTLHAGLESGLGAAAPTAGVPLLGAGRLGWEGKQRQPAAKAVDQVYNRIQAAKAADTPLLSPLDAAKDATRLAPVGGSRRGSSRGTHPAAGQPAGEAAAVPSDGSEAEEAVSLPRSRRASSLDSGASLTDAEPGDGEAADGSAGASLGAACEPDQQLAASTLQPGNTPAEQPAAPRVGSEEGGAEEAAQLEKATGGGASFSGGRPSSPQEPEEQGHVEAVTGEGWSGGQPDGGSIQRSTSKPEEASTGACGGSRCSEGAEDGGQGSVAAPAAADEEPVTAVMLEAEVAAAVAGEASAAVAEALPADGEAAPSEEPVVTAAVLAAEAEALGAGMVAVAAPPEVVAQAGAEASVPPGAGPTLAAAQAPEPADQSSESTAVSLEAAATESLAAAEVEPLVEPSTGGAGAEPAPLAPQPAQEEPEAAGAAAPPAVPAQQDVMTAGAAVDLVCCTGERAAVTASASADEGRVAAEPANKQAAPACAAEDAAEGEVPVEAPPPGSSEQQATTVTGDTGEQPSPPSMEAGLIAGLALAPGREGAAAAAEVEQVQVVGEPEVAPAGLHEEQHAPAAGMEERAGGGEAAEAQVAAAADVPAAEPSCSGTQAGPGAGSPAEPAEAAAVEGSAVLQGQASEQRLASMAAADSAEAVGLTQRASASLMFGGCSAGGAGADSGMEEGHAHRAAAGASEAGWQAGEAGTSGSMDAPAVPGGSTIGEGDGGAAQPDGGEAGDSEP